MKLKQIFLLFTAILFVAVSANAQDNNIKLGLGSLTAGNINLKYERAVGEKSTVQLTALYDIPSGFKVINRLITIDEIENGSVKVNKKGIMLVPEYRYYFSKKGAMRGFYGGVYAKYANYKVYSDIEIGDDNIPTYVYVNPSWFGLGLNIGAQWLINDKISIDWNIGGLGFNITRTKFGFESEEGLSAVKSEILEFIDENRGDVNLNDEFIDAVRGYVSDISETKTYESPGVPYALPDFRLGISIGYAF